MVLNCSRRSVLAYTAAACAVSSTATFAQGATSPLRLLVGFPPGGATDILARQVARQMTGFSAVIIENRPGAGSRIAVEATVRAKPDGLTGLVTPDFSLTLLPHLYRKLAYDPLKDLAPVAMCATSETALAVGPSVPAEIRTVKAFLQWAQTTPGQAMFASPSPGSTPHFTGVMLAQSAKAQLTHVAYKGGAQALQDLMGGQVPASFNPVGELLPQLASGKLRVLATSGSKRSPFMPDVPTFVDAGYRDVVVESWIGMFAPSGTPDAALDAMARSASDALRSKAVAEGFAKFGLSVAAPVTRQRMAAIVREDLARWSSVVKSSGFSIEE
ncbi:Bug family tripartite tricarboxylate transporter substrate binding protein [Variovorax boronicumulans]|uniref:Bug family tripartite tricarboxylate transporter substrate binding protein n=1 Tax=Variovorax boronicumulans TaxID=436515 RepID=UPI0027D7D05A|nr:tripartite tricarboxylate transporter substrate-binding protein [Variovorax boronicumulans]